MFFECTPIQLHNYGLLLSLLLGGIVGGFSHCTFMCAPYVLSLQQKTLGRVASTLLIPYHLGRMTTYIFLGVCAYFFLSYAFPSSMIRVVLSAVFLFVAALLFWIQALPVLGRYLPFLMRLSLPASLCGIQGRVSNLLEKPNFLTLYGVGILLGFIPCGLVMGAMLAVSTADSLGKAALGMGLFAIGTMPSLILVAVFGKSLATLLPRGWGLFAQWVLVLNGVVLLVLAGQLIMTLQ